MTGQADTETLTKKERRERWKARRAQVATVVCAKCGAPVGWPCMNLQTGRTVMHAIGHVERMRETNA
jgi:hypothetical protein